MIPAHGMRHPAWFFVIAVLSASAAALDRGCSQGVGEWTENLWDGYKVEIAATPSGAPAQCRAALKSADGKVQFEVTGAEALVNPISGTDINGDGKPDVVIETHRTAGQCCYTYSILTPGETPLLQRQITTTPPLVFEDRDGNGKIEITTHDFAFVGIEGLGESDSPRPLVVFRLRGSTLYNVSPAYWPEYQHEVEVAKAGISRSAQELLLGRNNNSGHRRGWRLEQAQRTESRRGEATVGRQGRRAHHGVELPLWRQGRRRLEDHPRDVDRPR